MFKLHFLSHKQIHKASWFTFKVGFFNVKVTLKAAVQRDNSFYLWYHGPASPCHSKRFSPHEKLIFNSYSKWTCHRFWIYSYDSRAPAWPHQRAVWVGKWKIPWRFAHFWSNFWEAIWFWRYDGGSSNQKTWLLFLALSLTWWMTQDKWLPHICQVSESKCETHTIPFSLKLPLHSPSFPHICSTVVTSVMPRDTLYKLQLSSCLLTWQPTVPGVQNPKAEGKVQSYKSVLSKASTSALHELKPETSREALFLEHNWSHFQGLAPIICWRHFQSILLSQAYVSSIYQNISARMECCNLWLKKIYLGTTYYHYC